MAANTAKGADRRIIVKDMLYDFFGASIFVGCRFESDNSERIVRIWEDF